MFQLQRLFSWSWLCLLVSPAYPQVTNLGEHLFSEGDRGPPHGGIAGSHDGSFDDPSTNCSPCFCYKIKSRDGITSSVVNCSDKNLTRIPKTLPNLTSSLNFSGNRLENEEFGSLCERYRNLTNVSFAANGLKVLPKVLRGCQTSLKELTLTGNKLTVANRSAFGELQGLHSLRGLWVTNRLPQSVFTPLNDLSRLELTYMASVLPEDLFKPLANLRVLWLTLDGTQGLPDNLALPSGLTELRLSGIKLKHLPAGLLKNLDNIKTLHIDLPELRHLEWRPEDIAAANLENLTVKGVWEISSESLAQMTSLVSLTLQDIRSLADTAFFNNLGNLKNLEIINCSLASDTLQWMKNLHTLTSLSLRQAQLAKFSPGTLSGLSALQNLDLSVNQLREFPEGFLLHVKDTLEGLDLSMNLLTHLDATSFPSLPSLKGLDISQNRLTSLDLDILMRTPSLSELIAQGNALVDVSSDQIRDDDSIHLSLLDLSNNLLETIPDGVPLEKVATLDMSHNPLTQGFPIDRLESLSKPVVVELHTTPIACHCDLYFLVTLDFLTGGICSSPPSVRNQAMNQDALTKLCNRTEDDAITTYKELEPVEPVEPEEQNSNQKEKEEDDWDVRPLGPAKEDNDDTNINSVLPKLQTVTTAATENEQVVQTMEGTSTILSDFAMGGNVTDQSEAVSSTSRPTESNFKMTLPDGLNYTRDLERKTNQGDLGPYDAPEPTQKSSTTTEYPKQMSSSELPILDLPEAGIDTVVTQPNVSHETHSTAPATVKNYGHTEATDNLNVADVAKTLAPDSKCSNCSPQVGMEKQNSTNVIDAYNQSLSTPLSAWKGQLNVTEKSGFAVSNMSSHLGHEGSNDGRDNDDQSASSDHSFAQLPWVIAVCFLLILLGLGYMACRRKMQRGSHNLADDTGNENKAIAHGKMELMELGVAPPGGMPVIM